MLTVRRQCDYAARILLYLAMQPPGTHLTAREIARLRLMPPALTRRVVAQLVAAGFLRSRRGKGGGFALARSPAEISLLEVVEAIDGPVALNRCTLEPQECPLLPQCSVHEAWMDARRLLRDYLNLLTFRELARRGKMLLSPPSAVSQEASLSAR